MLSCHVPHQSGGQLSSAHCPATLLLHTLPTCVNACGGERSRLSIKNLHLPGVLELGKDTELSMAQAGLAAVQCQPLRRQCGWSTPGLAARSAGIPVSSPGPRRMLLCSFCGSYGTRRCAPPSWKPPVLRTVATAELCALVGSAAWPQRRAPAPISVHLAAPSLSHPARQPLLSKPAAGTSAPAQEAVMLQGLSRNPAACTQCSLGCTQITAPP